MHRYQRSVCASTNDYTSVLTENPQNTDFKDIVVSETFEGPDASLSNRDTCERSNQDDKRRTNGRKTEGKKESKKAKVTSPSRYAKPKRPMSAYNIFFHHERLKLLQSSKDADSGNGDEKMGFKQLAQNVSSRWKAIDSQTLDWHKSKASVDRIRYDNERKEYESR